jgi:hypothetical protein
MRKFWKCFVGVVSVVLLVSAYSAGTKAKEVTSSAPKYIEVCAYGTVDLPPGTKFVTCHGKIMEVIDVVPLAGAGPMLGGCECPRCCQGFCTVSVRCHEPEPSSEANEALSGKKSSGSGGLCTAYLACE